MSNFSTFLSKSIVGLTASVLLIPVMSTSASAATLKPISKILGLISENSNSEQTWCNPYQGGWTVGFSCSQNYTANAGLGISEAGSPDWLRISRWYSFTGTPGRRYRITTNLTGKVSGSVSANWLTGAVASSSLAPLSGRPVTSVNLASVFIRSYSRNRSYTSRTSFDFDGGIAQRFLLGALTRGHAEAYGIGSATANAYIYFNSFATITEIPRSRTSLASLASVASASSYSPPNASDDEVASVPDEGLINLSDDEVASVPDEDLINLPGDDVVTSVPESSTVAGLALVLTILLASKHSRFAKKHTKNTENLIDTTAVEV